LVTAPLALCADVEPEARRHGGGGRAAGTAGAEPGFCTSVLPCGSAGPGTAASRGASSTLSAPPSIAGPAPRARRSPSSPGQRPGRSRRGKGRPRQAADCISDCRWRHGAGVAGVCARGPRDVQALEIHAQHNRRAAGAHRAAAHLGLLLRTCHGIPRGNLPPAPARLPTAQCACVFVCYLNLGTRLAR